MASRAVLTRLKPRGLARGNAAAYCGLTLQGFDEWVKRGVVPGPIPGTQRWDRLAVDLALDRASGIARMTGGTAFEQWKARRAGHPPRAQTTRRRDGADLPLCLAWRS